MDPLAEVAPTSSRWLIASCGARWRRPAATGARGHACCTRSGSGPGPPLTGWIATSPKSPKASEIADVPAVSLTYWSANHDTCSADCDAAFEESAQPERPAGTASPRVPRRSATTPRSSRVDRSRRRGVRDPVPDTAPAASDGRHRHDRGIGPPAELESLTSSDRPGGHSEQIPDHLVDSVELARQTIVDGDATLVVNRQRSCRAGTPAWARGDLNPHEETLTGT